MKAFKKNAIGQGDDYTTACLLDFPYPFLSLIVIVLSKNQALDADPKAIQETSFTGNLD